MSAPESVDTAPEEHTVSSTVPVSGVSRAAGLVEVIPMFDGSADDSEHEVGVAPVGRRRLVLVSQGALFLNLVKAGWRMTDFLTTASMEFSCVGRFRCS